jgi:predicted unusual protein kinase regulating ubiquinone biosynthesis (AarF/ABC1/UbiB family)
VNLRAYWRFLVVTRQLLPLLLAYARDRRRFLLVGGTREVSAEQRRSRAETLLDSMLTLGPTFIKLGQLLSTRPDVLPPEYLAEFTKLQDRVPPADWEEARTVVDEDLGRVEEQFDELDTDPISGASLGQVYEGVVDGQRVAVKVRRPGVEELVEADLRVIRWSLPVLVRFVDDVRSFSLETLADEFARTIRQEMDYGREAEMLQEIRGNFRENDSVRIPAVVESRSTDRVLTMEYVEGTKISNTDRLDRKGIDRTELAERLQSVYLQMIMEDGVFHADPHPGNLAVTDDGTLVLYDFGMSDYIDPYIQDNMVEFYGAVVRQDIDAVIDALVEVGTLSPDADRELMREILELAITDLRGGEVDQYRIQRIVDRIENTIYEFPFRIPSHLALVLRVATVVEGVCVALDPEFDFVDAAQTYFTREGYIQDGARQYVRNRGEDVRTAAAASVRVPPKLESTLDRIDRDDLRVDAALRDPEDYFERLAWRMVLGVVFAAGIVSTTVLAVTAPPLAAVGAGVGTAIVGILLYRSFQTGVTFYSDSDAQFTRQRLREQDQETTALGFESEDGASDVMSTPGIEDGVGADEGPPDSADDADGATTGANGSDGDGAVPDRADGEIPVQTGSSGGSDDDDDTEPPRADGEGPRDQARE